MEKINTEIKFTTYVWKIFKSSSISQYIFDQYHRSSDWGGMSHAYDIEHPYLENIRDYKEYF